MIRIAVADYGAGNLVSICRAIEVVGAEPAIVRDAAALRGADGLIVPGVGAAGPAMERPGSTMTLSPLWRNRASRPSTKPRMAGAFSPA